jgi:hypothetical protein
VNLGSELSAGWASEAASGLATGVGVFADPLGYWVDRHKVHHHNTYRAAWRPTMPAGRTLDEFLRAATVAPWPADSNPEFATCGEKKR